MGTGEHEGQQQSPEGKPEAGGSHPSYPPTTGLPEDPEEPQFLQLQSENLGGFSTP